jgi:hypothetical protein
VSVLQRRNKSDTRLAMLRRFRADESGQALTEFVVVVPIMVMILLFSMWLWEIVHIKLKVQEAARYAAWESTSYPLHGYAKGSSPITLRSLLPFSTDAHFLAMRARVSTEAMIRYANLDASRLNFDHRLLLASWRRPLILIPGDCHLLVQAVTGSLGAPVCGNLEEPIIYGGPWASLLFKLGAMIYTVGSALRYASPNPIATALIATGGGNAFFGGGGSLIREALTAGGGSTWAGSGGKGGGALVTPFGGSQWNFNSRGYVRAIAMTQIENNWFNVRIMGKPLFRRRSFLVMSEHAVLADSWRLNTGRSVADDPDDKKARKEARKKARKEALARSKGNWLQKADDWVDENKEGMGRMVKSLKAGGYYESGSGAYWDQLDRMYLGRPQARVVFGTFVGLFRGIMTIAQNIAGMPTAPDISDEDWMYPALSAVNYEMKKGKLRGPIKREEDVAKRKYHTAPFLGEYARTFQARGDSFMGCQAEQQLGCVSTLAQDDPFGSYINRSGDEAASGQDTQNQQDPSSHSRRR